MIKKTFLLFSIVILQSSCLAQNIYPEKFSDCNTDHFALESDSCTAKIDMKYLAKTILSSFDDKTKSKIKDVLSLQIVVDTDGRSCLLSLENKTNIKTAKLNLKKNIDENLIWNNSSNKVSALIILKFNSNSIQFKRIGINGKKVFHVIEENEILRE